MSSEKKRKATATLERRPKKKAHTSTRSPADTINVEHIPIHGTLRPIIATTPGASLPSDIKFNTYAQKNESGSPTLLLQSSEHPTIDYTATEGAEANEPHTKHYIAVYDPSTSSIKITEAKALTVRGAVRQPPKADEDEEDSETQAMLASQGTRAALTEAFGSKKSKKAVASMAENRQLGQGVEGQTIAEVIASHLKHEDEDEDELAALATSRSHKPVPRPNLETDDVTEVYSISSLVAPKPASNTLQGMPIEGWTARLKIGKEVTGLRSRFVANRIAYVGKHMKEAKDETGVRIWTQQLQILRYLHLLLEIHAYVSRQDRRRKMDWVDKWPEGTTTGNIPSRILGQAVNHFFPENTPSERAMTLFRTTILALTLHILPPSGRFGGNQLAAELNDIMLDLAMKQDEVSKLYRELGCKVQGASEKELQTWGLTRLTNGKKKNEDGSKVPKPVFAILRFPLDFPKISSGRKARK